MSIENLKNTLIKDKKLFLSVRIRPNAERSELTGHLADGSLKINLAAPAVDNKANQALLKLLAQEFSVNIKAISIISGQTSRLKLVKIVILD